MQHSYLEEAQLEEMAREQTPAREAASQLEFETRQIELVSRLLASGALESVIRRSAQISDRHCDPSDLRQKLSDPGASTLSKLAG
jgi:hypothetical protein